MRLLPALLVLTACSTPKPAAPPLDPAESKTLVLFDGLLAKPGSVGRARAANILAESAAPLSGISEPSAVVTRKVIGWTLDFVAGKETCEPSQRIRLYRGIGSHPLLRHDRTERPFVVYSSWKNDLLRNIKLMGLSGKVARWTKGFDTQARPELEGTPIGELIVQNAARLQAGTWEGQDWQLLMGKNRKVPGQNFEIDYKWDELALAHTLNSNNSPLLSATLSPDVARRFGPAVLVLDVCPQRVFPYSTVEAFTRHGETEMYIPLVILPEEIVRVEGEECGVAVREGLEPSRCTMNLEDNGEITHTTRAMRACYMPAGTSFESTPLAAREITAIHAQRVFPALRQALADAPSAQSWIAAIIGSGSFCHLNCEAAKSLLQQSTKLLATSQGKRMKKDELASLQKYREALTNKLKADSCTL